MLLEELMGKTPSLRYTLSEVAHLSGLHRDTIKRRLEDGSFPNASRSADRRGTWLVPLSDLVDSGVVTGRETPPGAPASGSPGQPPGAVKGRTIVAKATAGCGDSCPRWAEMAAVAAERARLADRLLDVLLARGIAP